MVVWVLSGLSDQECYRIGLLSLWCVYISLWVCYEWSGSVCAVLGGLYRSAGNKTGDYYYSLSINRCGVCTMIVGVQDVEVYRSWAVWTGSFVVCGLLTGTWVSYSGKHRLVSDVSA